jgi:hypothetical protein
MSLEPDQKNLILETVKTFKPVRPEKYNNTSHLVDYRNKFLSPVRKSLSIENYEYQIKPEYDSDKARFTEIPNLLVDCANNTSDFSELREISKHLVDPLRNTAHPLILDKGGNSNIDLHNYINSVGNFLYILAEKGIDLRGTPERNVRLIIDSLQNTIKLHYPSTSTRTKIAELQKVFNHFKMQTFTTQEMEIDLQATENTVVEYQSSELGKIEALRDQIASGASNGSKFVVEYTAKIKKLGATRSASVYSELSALFNSALQGKELNHESAIDQISVMETVSSIFKNLVEEDNGTFQGRSGYEMSLYFSYFISKIPGKLITQSVIDDMRSITARLETDNPQPANSFGFDYQPKTNSHLNYLRGMALSLENHLLK